MRWMETIVVAKLFCERCEVVGMNARPFLFKGFFFEAIGINDECTTRQSSRPKAFGLRVGVSIQEERCRHW